MTNIVTSRVVDIGRAEHINVLERIIEFERASRTWQSADKSKALLSKALLQASPLFLSFHPIFLSFLLVALAGGTKVTISCRAADYRAAFCRQRMIWSWPLWQFVVLL